MYCYSCAVYHRANKCSYKEENMLDGHQTKHDSDRGTITPVLKQGEVGSVHYNGRPVAEGVAQDTAEWRKQRPITRGLLDYFPEACLEVANCSYVGNEQHHQGAPLHWDKSKSTDESDALVRHLLERGTLDSDGVRHSAKVAWRAMAMLQRELDAEK
jgi:hypothetical protein